MVRIEIVVKSMLNEYARHIVNVHYRILVPSKVVCLCILLLLCGGCSQDAAKTPVQDEIGTTYDAGNSLSARRLWAELAEMTPTDSEYLPLYFGNADYLPIKLQCTILTIQNRTKLWYQYRRLLLEIVETTGCPIASIAAMPPSLVHITDGEGGLAVYLPISMDEKGRSIFVILFWSPRGQYWYSTHAVPRGYHFSGDAFISKDRVFVLLQGSDGEVNRQSYDIQTVPTQNSGPIPNSDLIEPLDLDIGPPPGG
jgi:hypothetical protein